MKMPAVLADRRKRALQSVAEGLEECPEFSQVTPATPEDSSTVTWRATIKAAGKDWDTQINLGPHFPDEPPQV